MPKFLLNGKPHEKEKGTTVAMLVKSLNLSRESVIVEFNGEFLERERFESTVLGEGDRVEIIRAFAGG
jgi:thiamine biosynthesis protein ThiS